MMNAEMHQWMMEGRACKNRSISSSQKAIGPIITLHHQEVIKQSLAMKQARTRGSEWLYTDVPGSSQGDFATPRCSLGSRKDPRRS